MSKAARFIPELDERSAGGLWSALVAAAGRRAGVAAGWVGPLWLAAAVLVAAGAFAAGAVAGSRAAQPSTAHQAACAALHMAAAHGYLDERQQRVVMHAMGTALNPQADLFPGGYRALREACAAAAASDAAAIRPRAARPSPRQPGRTSHLSRNMRKPRPSEIYFPAGACRWIGGLAVQKTVAASSNHMMEIRDPREARRIIRAGEYTGHTAGIAPDCVQGNLCILPLEAAQEFAAFCQRNPKPCPVIGMGAPGDPTLPDLGDIDIRTDVPRYRVFKDGKLVDEPADIRQYWSDDLVTFAIGCSFSFELPLIQEGIPLQHVVRNTTVPMYRTSIDCVPAGRFRGKMVVSMRPLTPADAIRAVQVTSRFPAVHGAPVHLGLPEMIGIKDIMRPDWGDPPEMSSDQLPVFWGCGVTPQVAIEAARPSICITHKPGSMLITDKKNTTLAAL